MTPRVGHGNASLEAVHVRFEFSLVGMRDPNRSVGEQQELRFGAQKLSDLSPGKVP